METTSNQVTAQGTSPTLQLKRSLLPIDEYAARAGLSRGTVEERGSLGIVQIRKYRGKIFVVDVPISPYRCAPEDSGAVANTDDNSELLKNISELGRRASSKDSALQGNRDTGTQDTSKASEKRSEPDGEPIEAGAISALVEKMCRRASQITGKPLEELYTENSQVEGVSAASPAMRPRTGEDTPEATQATSVSAKKEGASELSGRMFCGVSQIFNKLKGRSDGGIARVRSRQDVQDYESLPSDMPSIELGEELQVYKPPAQVDSKRVWQAIASITILFLLGALVANVWLYRDRRTHVADLDQAYTSIQTVYSDFLTAGQQVASLGNELTESKTEIQRIRNELDRSRREAETIRDELAEARQSLKTIQRRHAQVLGGLNEEVHKLAAWLKKPNVDPQASSDPGVSDDQ